MLLKGTYTVDNIPTYEQCGVSPSPDYPSEVETVNGSVKIDVVNKNLFDIKELGKLGANYTELENGCQFTANQKMYDVGITLDKPISMPISISYKIKNISGSKYRLRFWYDNGSIESLNAYGSETDNTEKSIVINNFIRKDTKITKIGIDWFLFGRVQITDFIITESVTAADYVPHKSQTAIMPIQQEMLDGDYVANVEHHEWKKSILTGVEEVDSNFNTNGSIFFGAFISDKDTNNGEMVCNNYLYQPNKTWQQISNYGFCGQKGSNNVFIRDDRFTTKTDFLNHLKQQYEAGTPVTISYKLATPVDLELTEEQKAIRDTRLYTYKNITNIAVSDELASIDVTYKKDLETMFNNIIKQIPSSTSDTAET